MALRLSQSGVMQRISGLKVAIPSSAKPCILRHSATYLSRQWQPSRSQHIRPAPACQPPRSSPAAASPAPANEPDAPRPALFQFLHDHSKALTILASLALLAALAALALPTLTHHAAFPSALLPPPPMSPQVTSATLQIASAAKWVNAVPDLLRQQLDGAITRLSAAPLWARLLSMFLIGVPIILPLGHLYSRASGLDLRTATLKMYALLYRAPGGSIINDQANSALLIANCTYFAGVFVFAVLLGFVGDDVKSRIKAVRSGTYALHLQHHMLVLNWNRNTVPLLRQMAAAQKDPESPFFKRPVVVLSERPKAEMQEELATGLRGYDMEVHTRTGTPFRVSDLRRVNAADAGAVIMLQPSEKAVAALGGVEASEAVKAATLMTLFSSPGEKCKATRLVVQSSPGPPSEVDVLRAVSKSSGLEGRLQVLRTDDRVIANRLLAQTAMQPGLASVYNEIVQQGVGRARALFVPLPPAQEALTYRDVRRLYPAAVVLGYIPSGAAKKLVLNPADHIVLNKGDRLLLLTRKSVVQPSPEAEITYAAAAEHARMWATNSRPLAVKARRIVVAGWWLKDLPLLLDSLAEFAPRGSSVTVVTEEAVGKELMKARGNCRFASIVARHPTAVQTLREAGVKEASAVLVGGLERATDVESEARVLAALVQVQEACQLEGRKDAPHVVAKVRQPNTSKVARQYLQAVVPARSPATARRAAGTPRTPNPPIPVPTAEFLLPEEFFSAIISQVAADPDYQLLIQELLGSAEGQEVYIHPATQYYMDPGMTVTFADVEEAVRVKGQTALGLLLREGRCMLVPGASCSLKLREGDSIIVLAEDYQVVAARD